MGGTSTISGGKLCLRIDPRLPTLSGCAASRGAGVQPGAHLDAERLDRVADRHRAADRPLRAVEHREEPVARCVHLAAAKANELRLEFEERGAHELKGVPGQWRLFTVAS
jgi:hypothetical protein